MSSPMDSMAFDYNENANVAVQLTDAEFRAICQQVFRNVDGITTPKPFSSGAVNTTYGFSRNGEYYVLRIYVRDPSSCEIERLILQKVQEHISVPELIDSHENGTPYPFAIFRFVPGVHLFELEDPACAPEVSYALGATLAKIHQFRFPQAGLFGSALSCQVLFDEGSRPYYQYIKEHLVEGSKTWERLGDRLAKRVLEFVDVHQKDFPIIKGGGVLVHSDFKPVNLLWNPERGLTVLDWEFAHSCTHAHTHQLLFVAVAAATTIGKNLPSKSPEPPSSQIARPRRTKRKLYKADLFAPVDIGSPSPPVSGSSLAPSQERELDIHEVEPLCLPRRCMNNT